MRKILFALCIFSFLAAAACAGGFPAGAQVTAPQILVNWQADSYVPPGYSAKALPAADSRITISVDVFDLGKRANLSTQKIYWYVNNSFLQGAPGMTRITLNAPHIIGDSSIEVRVSLPDYAGGPAKTVTIPVVPPQAVIQTSATSLAASAAPFTLQAYPYFFNVQSPSQLQFSWLISGALLGSQNPFVVTAQAAEGRTNALLELRVANPARPIERTTQKLIIFTRQ